MPRLEIKTDIDTAFSPEARMLVRVLLAELNQLREWTGLPPRTEDDLREALRQYQRTQRREEKV